MNILKKVLLCHPLIWGQTDYKICEGGFHGSDQSQISAHGIVHGNYKLLRTTLLLITHQDNKN